MKRIIFIVSAVCAAGLIATIVGSHAVSAQNENPGKGDKDTPRHFTTRIRRAFYHPI
jgi:hypothetical protein